MIETKRKAGGGKISEKKGRRKSTTGGHVFAGVAVYSL